MITVHVIVLLGGAEHHEGNTVAATQREADQ